MFSNVREKICAYSITWSARASKVAGTARRKRSRCLKIDCKLEFDVKVIPHKGDTDWIEPLIFKMNDCLRARRSLRLTRLVNTAGIAKPRAKNCRRD